MRKETEKQMQRKKQKKTHLFHIIHNYAFLLGKKIIF